jgi:hypothetical protein
MAKKKQTESDALAPVRETWHRALATVQNTPLESVGELRESARQANKELDAARKEAKKPFLDGGRDVDARYKAVTDTLDKVIRMCDDRILAASAAKETALRALVQDTTLAPVEKHAQLQTLQATVVPGGVRLRVDYDYEVISFDEVPREYLVVDDKRVRDTIKDTAGTVEIPGIRVVRKHTVVAK